MPRSSVRVYLTKDEEYNVPTRIAERVKAFLQTLKMDTYNEQYVIRVMVDRVSPPDPDVDDE